MKRSGFPSLRNCRAGEKSQVLKKRRVAKKPQKPRVRDLGQPWVRAAAKRG